MGLTILSNPPYGRGGLHKRIFREMCKHATVFSLQPYGSCKTHEGYTAILFPLHTSVKMFNIALMPLEVCTNNKDKSRVDLDKCKFVTVKDGKLNGTMPLAVGPFNGGNAQILVNPVQIKQQPLSLSSFKRNSDTLSNAVPMRQPQPPKVRHPGVGNDISNTVTIKQPESLEVSTFKMSGVTPVNGVKAGQLEPLKATSFHPGVPRKHSCSNGASLVQTETPKEYKNLLWFNTKKERTNFIKNISKIIALQILFSSNIFPQDRDRLLPPLDREYSKDELLDYFNFPKDVYKEFDDIEKEEPNSHYTSFEKWRDYRKEKYGLDFEEE